MIKVENLSKFYKDKGRKKIKAVNNVSFECHPGKVYGLLGPNGAGKTTTLRIISTALRPTEGTAFVQEHDIRQHPRKVRENIGFLSANTGLYGRLTPREVLKYFGALYGMPPKRIAERTDELAETLTMQEFLNRPCEKLSTGMKQKVNIARSVLHDPPVMVFDEPTSGLDILTGRAIVDFIRRCKDSGRTILFSTHIMAEVAKLCDNVGVIHKGMMLFDGTLEDMRKQHGEDVEDAFLALCTKVEAEVNAQ